MHSIASARLPVRFTINATLVAGICLVAGCAGVAPRNDSFPETRNDTARECAAWLSRAEQLIAENGVRDAGAYPVPGFPYLRVDRLSASLRDKARQSPAAFDAWATRLMRIESDARAVELANLPAAARAALGANSLDNANRCLVEVARDDLSSPARREALIAAATVPDNYDETIRSSGIYAAARIPFSKGVEGWQAEAAEMFRKTAVGKAHGANLVRYAPWNAAVPPDTVRKILSGTPVDVLGVPMLGPNETNALFAAYAPYIEVETNGAFDRVGALGWGAKPAVEVDPAKPVIYRRLAYTQNRGKVLLQLVYTAWFTERPASGAFDLLSGKLDGLVFRVTLDETGRPLVYDTIHPCGCYHMFLPTALVKALPAPDPDDEWALIPATVPATGPGERVVIRLASGSHHLVGIRPVGTSVPAGAPYVFAEDDSLRRLPMRDGTTRSAFGPDGLIAGSERLERAFFWPMGIESPGTMRQWGRHPTAFLGRRHFDDADLIEKRFAPAQ